MKIIAKRRFRRYCKPFFYKIYGNPHSVYLSSVVSYYTSVSIYELAKSLRHFYLDLLTDISKVVL